MASSTPSDRIDVIRRQRLRCARGVEEDNANMGWPVQMDGSQLLLVSGRHIGLMVDIDSPTALRAWIAWRRGQIDLQRAAGPPRAVVG